jgi:hypothetical protein
MDAQTVRGAERKGLTLRALVERGLNKVIGEMKHAGRSGCDGPRSRARECSRSFATPLATSCGTRFIEAAALIAVDTNILVYNISFKYYARAADAVFRRFCGTTLNGGPSL